MKKLVVLLSIVFLLMVPLFRVHADELDDVNKQLDDLKHQLDLSLKATKPLEEEVQKLQKQLDAIRFRVSQVEKGIAQKEKEVEIGEKALAYQKQLLDERTRSYYKNIGKSSFSLLQFLAGENLSVSLRNIFYQKSMVNEDRRMIVKIVLYIKEIEKKKADLESEKLRLAQVNKRIDKQSSFLSGEIKKAKKYQKDLSIKIAELTKRQKELLSQKTELFSTSVGDVPLADDPASRPDYNPGFSPAFAAFSFGAPHFKGMSQYGALGRAKSGQGFEQILKAYYGDIRIETVDTNFDLPTTIGNLPFEDNYLKGIAEMPAKWADEGGWEALKAQAIAARSYALAYTGWRMGSRNPKESICITEKCQVYNSGKAANPGRWGDAVNETKGKIIVSNQSGEVVNAWYSSTSGGYQESYSSLGHTTPAFWDTKNGRNGWTSEAYEKIGGSPWFYKGWYKTRSGKNCGRSHPWLTETEFADIINALLVYSNGGDASGIFPIDVNSCFGGNDQPWSYSRMASEADNYGGRVTSISAVNVQYASNGITAKIDISTNRGTLSFSGKDFYKVFNLRAPGAIHLKSGLFNIEKK